MKPTSAKNKIIILIACWLLLTASMFFYFFKILDGQNQQTLSSMAQDQSELALLSAQNQSFQQAQSDLQKMAAEPIQPDSFFSRDITLVSEIQTLDDLATKYNVIMQIAGVSGTVDTEQPAATATAIVLVPYSVTLSGTLQSTTDFIENLENLPFITTVTNVSVSSAGKGLVNTDFSANFYLRK